jgi:fermentation-respiration switch protein FrsA (DUF1100 family)
MGSGLNETVIEAGRIQGVAVRRNILRGLALILILIAAVYLAGIAYLFLFQRSFVFHPGGTLVAPAALGLDAVETVQLKAEDGTELAGWFAPPSPGRPVVLYFAGNAGNISDRANRFKEVLASGFGLLAMSYRGFPGSGGSPSEAALFSDALESFDWLAERGPTTRCSTSLTP